MLSSISLHVTSLQKAPLKTPTLVRLIQARQPTSDSRVRAPRLCLIAKTCLTDAAQNSRSANIDSAFCDPFLGNLAPWGQPYHFPSCVICLCSNLIRFSTHTRLKRAFSASSSLSRFITEASVAANLGSLCHTSLNSCRIHATG